MKKGKLLILSVLSLIALAGCSKAKSTDSSTYSSNQTSGGETTSSQSSSKEDSSTNLSSDEESNASSELTTQEDTSSKEEVSIETSVDEESSETSEESSEDYGSDYDYNSEVSVEDPDSIIIEDNTGEFSISTSDGNFVKTDIGYTIISAGTYTLSGKLDGQILVEAKEEDEVIIELNNVTISYDQDSPIKGVSADKIEISAKKGTENTINDNRSVKTIEDENQGEAAIYADLDLKLKGTGVLQVTGNYNHAISSSKDLTIQKLTLVATGYNNALKGKDSVTITSGTVQAYAKTGNGIKSDDSDISSKGNQRGTIAINGGEVYVDSLHDAIDASYNVEIDQLDSEVATNITIKTGKNAKYYSSSTFKADSEKGIKAQNDIIINNGTITIAASDDAIHANYGISLDNGNLSTGNITVNNGLIQVASGDDGLHSDNTLTINGGKIVVTGATEGFEANYININGGSSYIYGTDDGVNCSKKSFSNCVFTMTDGYLDVAVRNGDTDGIDSNGDFYLKGGVIVTRGSPGTQGSGMSTGLDVDGTCSMSGGTLIAFNGLERSPSTSSGILYASTSGSSQQGGGFGPGGHGPGGSSGGSTVSLKAGNYNLSGTGINIDFTNDYDYGRFLIYSSLLSLNNTYTLSNNGSTVLSWNQSSSSVTISQ